MSEKSERERLVSKTKESVWSFRSGDLVKLGHGIEISLDRLDKYALQLMALNPDKDWVEEIIPLACEKLYQMRGFLLGISPAELEFVATHGRRWRPGEGVVLPDALIFDPAKPAESCKIFRSKLKGTPLPQRDAFLEKWIRECHEIYLQRREKLGQRERIAGFEGFIFVGKEIEGLKRYMRIRSAKSPLCQESEATFSGGARKNGLTRLALTPSVWRRPALFSVQI